MLSIIEDKYEDVEAQYLMINSSNIIILNSTENFEQFQQEIYKIF